jgi:acyl-coenzyme A thioesterase PaaI-like protein
MESNRGYSGRNSTQFRATSFHEDAAMTLAPSGTEVLTVEFKISLLAPAEGQRFLATGSVLRAGKRLFFCSGEVRAIRKSGEELIATIPSTIITKTV